MAALLPHAAATWDGCHLNDAEGTPGYDAARVRRVEKREKDTWDVCLKDADAILEAAKHAPVKHLVDLAIVASALDMNGSLVERREVMAACALTRAVLGLAHVPESSCDLICQPINPHGCRLAARFAQILSSSSLLRCVATPSRGLTV